jgi:hypothetical protein
MMEALSTSETSVYFNETTRRYIPELVAVRTWNLTCTLGFHEGRDIVGHRRDY